MTAREDPFASFGGSDEKTPSVSWKNATPGTTVAIHVTEWPEQVQTTDYDTGLPEFWEPKNGETQGNPKMAIVITGTVGNETRALWVRRYPPNLWNAVVKAQKDAGTLIGPGGTLTVTTQGEAPSREGSRFQARLFTAAYKPADVFADAFGDPVAAPEPVATPPVAAPASTDALAQLRVQQATAKALAAQGMSAAEIAGSGSVRSIDGHPLGAAAVQAILNLA